MTSIIETAESNQRRAFELIKELHLEEAWKNYSAQANLVGSLRMGLLIKNLDIDYHVYSEKFNLSESFSAIAEIAENPGIKKVQYTNLIDTPEKCVEWHLWFEDLDKREWKIDMIHILKESQYAGVFENIADRIKATLTGESKMAILEIKNQLTSDDNTMGIEVYMAVIRDGINNIHEFRNWKKEQPPAGIIEWTP